MLHQIFYSANIISCNSQTNYGTFKQPTSLKEQTQDSVCSQGCISLYIDGPFIDNIEDKQQLISSLQESLEILFVKTNFTKSGEPVFVLGSAFFLDKTNIKKRIKTICSYNNERKCLDIHIHSKTEGDANALLEYLKEHPQFSVKLRFKLPYSYKTVVELEKLISKTAESLNRQGHIFNIFNQLLKAFFSLKSKIFSSIEKQEVINTIQEEGIISYIKSQHYRKYEKIFDFFGVHDRVNKLVEELKKIKEKICDLQDEKKKRESISFLITKKKELLELSKNKQSEEQTSSFFIPEKESDESKRRKLSNQKLKKTEQNPNSYIKRLESQIQTREDNIKQKEAYIEYLQVKIRTAYSVLKTQIRRTFKHLVLDSVYEQRTTGSPGPYEYTIKSFIFEGFDDIDIENEKPFYEQLVFNINTRKEKLKNENTIETKVCRFDSKENTIVVVKGAF
ncbi:hypothetical protein CDIK_2645 [Cucumispora dikerogammari]|nr:hypothetical protein CDIK_2645 [Cucumispora dikerogammari]